MKVNKDNIIEEIKIYLNDLVKMTFSNSEKGFEFKKIILRKVKIKEEVVYQFEKFTEKQVFHDNLNYIETLKSLEDLIMNFKQIQMNNSTNNLQILRNKEMFTVKNTTQNNVLAIDLNHDKEKNYILKEGQIIDFLIKLGVTNNEGFVKKEKFNKFKQINKYLEFIDITINELLEKNLINDSIKVVDFGCGKSYLTFALYYYLKVIKDLNVTVIGLDLKDEVIKNCTNIAKELNYSDLEFLNGDIKDFDKLKEVDLIFSLHACNNATDYAILKGVELNAKAILMVPCCQSEFNSLISKSKNTLLKQTLSPVVEHGILQEKVASLLTDTFRAKALELCGYNTKVMEFIDMSHTPKNILIKSIKTDYTKKQIEKISKDYIDYLNYLGIHPLLDNLLTDYFIK